MKKDLLAKMRNGENLKRSEKINLVLRLSVPAILAQISSILMEYIDAAMVGHISSNASAAIGIVSTTTWLVGGLCHAISAGFTVSVAHKIGAGEDARARRYLHTGLLVSLAFSLLLGMFCVLVYKRFPYWMGAEEAVVADTQRYFLIFGLSLPFMQLLFTGSGMLECSGKIKTASIINVCMCFLDVIFNALLIRPGTHISLFEGKIDFTLPGANLGVTGAALGTLLAEAVAGGAILLSLFVFSDKLRLRKEPRIPLSPKEVLDAFYISLPVMASSLVMGSAYVASTKIVSALGTISVATNSFAITAESFCYMPGYGISIAATTLVGQSKGAGRKVLTKQFSYLCSVLGILLMALSGVFLYIHAPMMIGILSPDPAIRELGTTILRIEAFAEPMFGASIVIEGVFRGLGKTMRPTILNLVSMWCVRIPLSALVAGKYGLVGVWCVMCGELVFRGIIFLLTLFFEFQKKQTLLKIIALFSTLFMMVFIFIQSAMPDHLSSEESNIIVEFIVSILNKTSVEVSQAELIHFIVRKAAHFTEFALLGAAIAFTLYLFIKKKLKPLFTFLGAWGLGTFYAATDEIHQLFTPGRFGQFTDVLIDSAGVALGAFILLLVCKSSRLDQKLHPDRHM